MLTELPELKEEEKMMEKIERKLNVQLIRLREEELAIQRMIREGNTDLTCLDLQIIEDDDILLKKKSVPGSISQPVVRLPQMTDKISDERLAVDELAVNQEPLSCLGSSMMPDNAFSEEEEEDDDDRDEEETSQNLMEIWKSMGQT